MDSERGRRRKEGKLLNSLRPRGCVTLEFLWNFLWGSCNFSLLFNDGKSSYIYIFTGSKYCHLTNPNPHICFHMDIPVQVRRLPLLQYLKNHHRGVRFFLGRFSVSFSICFFSIPRGGTNVLEGRSSHVLLLGL